MNDSPKKPASPPEVVFSSIQVAFGVGLIRSGIGDYHAWSERMITKYGESVREKLSAIFNEAKTQAVAVDAMQRAEREMLGPSVWRPLEDAAWSCNRVRENAMLPLRAAYNDLFRWDERRLKHAVETIDIRMVNRIFAEMEPLPEEVRNQCRFVVAERQVLEAAYSVQSAAYEALKPGKPGPSFWWKIERAATEMTWAAFEASGGAIKAASALTELATVAAKAAEAAKEWGANPDDVLHNACEIWIEAAKISVDAHPQTINLNAFNVSYDAATQGRCGLCALDAGLAAAVQKRWGRCPLCKGTGVDFLGREHLQAHSSEQAPCFWCHGAGKRGWIFPKDCEMCYGLGVWFLSEQQLQVFYTAIHGATDRRFLGRVKRKAAEEWLTWQRARLYAEHLWRRYYRMFDERHVSEMSGTEFEKFIGKLYTRLGYDVSLTPSGADQGVDLILCKDAQKIAVQAKRWADVVGNKAVQEVIAGKLYYGCSHAWIVTSSTFSVNAIALAAKDPTISLVDGRALSKLCEQFKTVQIPDFSWGEWEKIKEQTPPNKWWRACNCRNGRGNGGYWKGPSAKNRHGRAKSRAGDVPRP